MITDILSKLYVRELSTLQNELHLYSDETILWKVSNGISNSAGNLALHLVGNLNHFIGAKLGNTGYVRQRDLEFSDKNIPLKTLIEQIDTIKIMIPDVLSKLTSEDLMREIQLSENHPVITTELFLGHLLAHLSYHLGQVNYHRRLLDN